MCLTKLPSVGKDKLDTLWKNGMFAVVQGDSNELYVMPDAGAIKASTKETRGE